MSIFYVNKNVGETPLEALERLRVEKPELSGVALTYAGRLDPMAEGVLLVLSGEDIKNREHFLNLDKEYEFEILWGVETDTYDILGEIVSVAKNFPTKPVESDFRKTLYKFEGKFIQKYPPFSSKPVDGKPLFQWAREKRIEEIEIPEREVEVKELSVVSEKIISTAELEQNILEKILAVKGDFRQAEIMTGWKNFFDQLAKNKVKELCVTRMKAVVSSGTYVRGLAHGLGREHGCGALALSIKRLRIGEFSPYV